VIARAAGVGRGGPRRDRRGERRAPPLGLMRVTLAVVGRPRNRSLAAVIEEYETRASRYWPLDVREVKEESARGGTGASLVRRREGERLSDRVPAGTRLVACAADGDRFTSEEFAGWLGRERDAGRDVAFAIGGAYGLDEQLLARSASRLSLAPWTLPHELARLVLAEQLYRAGTLLRGEPYHK
jgi:23S rRNA (pseudouridine1915-N3)-methyltransferase